MACCVSGEEKEMRAKNAEIERQIENDRKQLRREVKILLLGAGESGKSTIVKQMKIIHKSGFTREELITFKPTVFSNTMQSIQAIVAAMPELKIDYEHPENEKLGEELMITPYDLIEEENFTPAVAQRIKTLWADAGVQACAERSREYYLLDSAQYYFEEIDRIGAPSYIPNEADVLRARVKTTGISETRFTMGQLNIHMFDVGGQRSERKKWIHCFENVTSIIFCVALSGYDMTLLEDSRQNRLLESLLLFESVVNSKWFMRTSIILFLNKIDIFKKKIVKYPLNKYFPEYTGGADFTKATEFILRRFAELNRAKLNIYPHLTCATDTSNIKVVFAAVKETILQNSLKDAGLM